MQFLFGSHNTNGYCILQCDGNINEAEQIKNIVTNFLPSQISDLNGDVYGYAPFDSNNNRPLFYRIKSDNDYSRKAYYIHAIYGPKNPAYYAGNTCYPDLFATFYEQEDINSFRDSDPSVSSSDKKKESDDLKFSIPAVFERELARCNGISDNAMKDIIAHIYSGDKIVITTANYSCDFARALVARIFDYLTPSLKKCCSFITSNLSSSMLTPAVLTIVAADKADRGDIIINIDDPAYTSGFESDFVNIAGWVYELAPAARVAIFAEYEKLLKGDSSLYSPKKFADYYSARFVDAVTAEKLVDNYLADIDDPLPDEIPAPFRDKIKPKFLNPLDSASHITVPPELLFDPITVVGLDSNKQFLKKLYAVYKDSLMAAVTGAYAINLNSHVIECSQLLSYADKVSRIKESTANIDAPAYAKEFYAASNTCFNDFLKRVARCQGIVDKSKQETAAYLSSLKSHIDNPDAVLNDILNHCSGVISSAERDSFNFKSALTEHIKKQIAAFNKNHPPVEAAQPKPAYSGAAEADVSDLDRLSAQFVKNTYSPQLTEDMLKLFDKYSRYPEVFKMYAARYASVVGENLKNGADYFFLKIDPIINYEIATDTAALNPLAAICLYYAYAVENKSYAFSDILEFIIENHTAFENISEERIQPISESFQKLIGDILITQANGITDEVVHNTLSRLERHLDKKGVCYSNADNTEVTGNALRLVCEAVAIWKSKGYGNLYICPPESSKGSSSAGAVVSAVIGLVVGAVVAFFLLKSGVLGDFPGKDSDDAPTTTGITTVATDAPVTDDEDEATETETDTTELTSADDENDKDEDRPWYIFKKDDITSISFEKDDMSVELELNDDSWLIPDSTDELPDMDSIIVDKLDDEPQDSEDFCSIKLSAGDETEEFTIIQNEEGLYLKDSDSVYELSDSFSEFIDACFEEGEDKDLQDGAEDN